MWKQKQVKFLICGSQAGIWMRFPARDAQDWLLKTLMCVQKSWGLLSGGRGCPRAGAGLGQFIWDSYQPIVEDEPDYCCSVAKSCPTLWDPMDFPVLLYLPESAQNHVHWVSDAIQPSHPWLPPSPLLSVFPSIRVFPNESALPIRWPKYWSFSFSVNPSNEYSELISFRIDWLDLLAVQGTQESSPAP